MAQARMLMQKKIHGGEEGASWGMDFEGEE